MKPYLPLALALLLPAVPTWAQPAAVCDSSTSLSLVGMDTRAGTVLLAAPPARNGGNGWLIELPAEAGEAIAWPDSPQGRYGGSVGPGPVVAARPCGPSCVQPLDFRGGTWNRLGEPLLLPSTSTVATTYDASGHPWAVAHGPGKTAGSLLAWGFRLDGTDWIDRGRLDVAGVGQPQAGPAPGSGDAVITGSGKFGAKAGVESWVRGLPSLPEARRGQLLPPLGAAAAYLSADGVLYLSADRGEKWRRSTWTPWGAGTTGMWRQGQDYSVDVPVGDPQNAWPVAWFDRRRPEREEISLSWLQPSGEGKVVATTPAVVTTKSGEKLPVTLLLLPRPDIWILLSGCAHSAEGSGLVLKVMKNGEMGAPRFVPIRVKG